MSSRGLPRAALGAVALLASVSAFGPQAVSAQNRPDSIAPDSVRFLGGITVSVAKPAIASGGSSSIVVDLDSLGSVPAPSMEQVLRAMPLVQIRTNSRGEAQPSLRGSEDRQIAILMDGVPLTLGWDHRTDMSIIPLTAAQDVTLVRGLSSVLYGPNTLGGVVQVDVARSQERVESVAPMTVASSVDATGATNLAVTGGHLVDDTDHQWVFRGGTGFTDRRGFPVAAGTRSDPDLLPQYVSDGDLRLNSDVRRFDGFFTARYRADEGVWGSLSASGYDVRRGVPPEANQTEPRFWRYPEQRRIIAAVSGGTGHRETGLGTGDVEISVGIDGGSTLIEAYETEAYQRVVETEDAQDLVVTTRLLGEHTLGPRGDVRFSTTYGDVRHDEVLEPGGANSYRQRLWSLGLETEWRFGSGGHTSVTVGGAYDGADTPESGDKPPLGRIGDYGVRAGVSSLVADGVLLHGNVSRRSRFPSLRELYSGALGRFVPNPDLQPETLLGTEAGFTVSGRLGEVQLVGFHHRLTNGIVRRSIPNPDPSGRSLLQRVNQAEIRSTGGELMVVGSLGLLTVTGDLTVQDAKGLEPDGSEVELEYEPNLAGKVGVLAPVPAEIQLGADLRYVGEQLCQNPEAAGLDPLRSSTVVDLSARRLFSIRSGGALSRLDVAAYLRNVTDASVFDQCGLPQPGRLFQVQFRIW